MINNIKYDSNNKRYVLKNNDGIEIKMPITDPDKKGNNSPSYQKEETPDKFQKILDVETKVIEEAFMQMPHCYEQYYYYQQNQSQMNLSQTSYQFRNKFKTKTKKKN